MSDLVGKPKARFSRITAHMTYEKIENFARIDATVKNQTTVINIPVILKIVEP